jgi:hypothetical protein
MQKAKTTKATRTLVADIASSPARTVQPPPAVRRGALQDGRQPKKAKQTVEPLPGTKVEDEASRMKSSQMIVEKLLAMTKTGRAGKGTSTNLIFPCGGMLIPGYWGSK